MKTIKNIMLLGILLASISCTKNNFINTGISDGRHEGKNVMEYMESHGYDWDSTLVMVRHAGADIVRILEGKDEVHKEITFFGMTNHSIRRYLLENGIKQISDLDADWCRKILLHHIVDGRYYRKDFPAGEPGNFGTAGTGGITLITLAGYELWVYVDPQETGGIVENAAKPITVLFKQSNQSFPVASGDIEPDNGVIHSLSYNFTIGDEE